MATDYSDDDTVRDALHIDVGDSEDAPRITAARIAASREVESFCGRRFWQDSAVVTREFYPSCSDSVDLLEQPWTDPKVEISTLTGLVVKTDDGTGTFGTTLTINTDFILLPRNAAADSRPWSEIQLVNGAYFSNLSGGRAACQVTAKFGWATVPDEVEAATVLQAVVLFKSTDTPFGAASLGDGATVYQRAGLHPVAKQLLASAGLARASVG